MPAVIAPVLMLELLLACITVTPPGAAILPLLWRIPPLAVKIETVPEPPELETVPLSVTPLVPELSPIKIELWLVTPAKVIELLAESIVTLALPLELSIGPVIETAPIAAVIVIAPLEVIPELLFVMMAPFSLRIVTAPPMLPLLLRLPLRVTAKPLVELPRATLAPPLAVIAPTVVIPDEALIVTVEPEAEAESLTELTETLPFPKFCTDIEPLPALKVPALK